MDHTKIGLLKLLIASGHSAEFFELAKKSFHLVPIPVCRSIQSSLGRAVRLVRDHGSRAVISTSLTLWLAIKALVADHLVDLLHSLSCLIEYRGQMRSVVILTRHHIDRDHGVFVRGRCNDLRAEAALAPPQRLLSSGPFYCAS